MERATRGALQRDAVVGGRRDVDPAPEAAREAGEAGPPGLGVRLLGGRGSSPRELRGRREDVVEGGAAHADRSAVGGLRGGGGLAAGGPAGGGAGGGGGGAGRRAL